MPNVVLCCDCDAPLSKPTAKYCSGKGHHLQYEGAPPSLNKDRHPDDDFVEDADQDVISISRNSWDHSHLSKAQTARSSASSSTNNLRHVKSITELRGKAIKDDANAKQKEKSHGTHGPRPANENVLKRTIVIWLCERPPIRPQQLGTNLQRSLLCDISLRSPIYIDQFVRGIVKGFQQYKDHSMIKSGVLVEDEDRNAYIGKVDSSGPPSFLPICDEYGEATVGTLDEIFGPKENIHLCFPVRIALTV